MFCIFSFRFSNKEQFRLCDLMTLMITVAVKHPLAHDQFQMEHFSFDPPSPGIYKTLHVLGYHYHLRLSLIHKVLIEVDYTDYIHIQFIKAFTGL